MALFSRSSSATATAPEPTFDAPTTAIDDITGDYTVDASHTRIGFSARHAMVTTVRGVFRDFAGTAHLDIADPAQSWVKIAIRTASIDTGSADRDAHLTSPDFFEAEVNPEITFVSTHVEHADTTWVVAGDLSIKGTAKPVTIEFEQTGSARDPFGNLRVGFEGTAAINRKDWDLTWNAALETGGVLVSERIKLEFDVSAIRNA